LSVCHVGGRCHVRPAPHSRLSYLAAIPDPRQPKGRRHPLTAILGLACHAILRGARGYAAIAQWGRDHEIALIHALGFTRTPPCQGAIQAVFARLDAEAFEAALSRWIQDLALPAEPEPEPATPPRPVALDGKTPRGSPRRFQAAVHLLATLDHRTGGVLSQRRVDDRTNEQKAALELLKGMVRHGVVITGDAMFCPRELCQEIRDRGGDYRVVVKDNQPTPRAEIAAAFEPPFSPSGAATPAPGGGPPHHGRQARRPRRDPVAGGDDAPGRLPGLARGGAGPPHPSDGARGRAGDLRGR